MKKFLFTILSILFIAGFSNISFATNCASAISTTSGTAGGLAITLSNNVSCEYVSGPSHKGATFSVATVNSKGTQVYGTASDMSVITYQDVGLGKSASAYLTTTNGNSKDVTGSSWKSLGE